MNNLPIRIQNLNNLDLSLDIPVADAPPISLTYVSNYDSNFEDYVPFCTGQARFLNEAILIKKLTEIFTEGLDKHCSLLYTWRSLSRPFSKHEVAADDKEEFHEAQYKLFSGPMESLFSFYNFIETAKSEFVSVISQCVKEDQKSSHVSDGILTALGLMINMFVILDDLRAAKTSVKNDLSQYKRICTVLKKNVGDQVIAELMSKVTLFLATPNEILPKLSDELTKIPESHKILILIIISFAEKLEKRNYLSVQDKYSKIRVILGCLDLISKEKNITSKLDNMKIPLSRLDKLLRDTPSIPLVGDMHSSVGLMLKKLNFNYEFSLLDSNYLVKVAVDYDVTRYVEEFEGIHIQIISEMLVILQTTQAANSYDGLYDLSPSDSARLFMYAERSLRTIGRMTYILHEIFFYKLSHPVDRNKLTKVTGEIDSYSLATFHNYNAKEKAAIARIIFLIKSFYKFLKSHENLITSAINTHIYMCFQTFIHKSAYDLIKKTGKSKVEKLKMDVNLLKLICADKIDYAENTKGKKADKNIVIKNRNVSPLSTQIYMVRTILESIISSKDSKKVIDSSIIQAINSFLNESILFTSLINYKQTLDDCCHLDSLWFKEFYIECSQGKHTQYPIGDSFPWIMMEHLLELSESDSYEFLLFMTCVYDDAAHLVLHKLRRRHLFDEIDSEAQLVFQQLCYHLSQRIYLAKRAEAFSLVIPKVFKNRIFKSLSSVVNKIEKINENSVNYSQASQMNNICMQRSVQYLGRKIDLNSLLSQRLLINFKQSIEGSIAYFELSNVESVVWFSSLIDVYSKVHSLLAQQFDIPPFSIILNEVNGNMPAYLPRITAQIMMCLLTDVAYNYSFCLVTERFVKSPVVFTSSSYEQPKLPTLLLFPSKSMAQAFGDLLSIYSKYIGIEHFIEIFKLVGYSGVVKIIEEAKNYIDSLIDSTLQQYIGVLRQGMPVKSILPQASYGFIGVVQFYNTTLETILKYEDMRPGVMHYMRILGNYMIIVNMLEKAIYLHESRGLQFSSPLSGCVNVSTENSSSDKISEIYDYTKDFLFEHFPSTFVPSQFVTLLKKGNELNQEKLCCGLSFFTTIIEHVADKLNTPFWTGPEPPNGVISLETCSEIHRILSVLFYYIAGTMKDPHSSVENEFGDGFIFAACTMIYAVGQQDIFECLDYCSHAISVYEMQSDVVLPMQFSSGTLKNTSRKKELASSDLNEDNQKLLASLRKLVGKRKKVSRFIANALHHQTLRKPQMVKCFHPPVFYPPPS